jgi:chorismate mutase
MTTVTSHLHVHLHAPVDEERCELDRLDEDIVALIEQRVWLAQRLAVRRDGAGAPRFVHAGELATVARFRRLGRLGTEMAALLVRLSRTPAHGCDGSQARM